MMDPARRVASALSALGPVAPDPVTLFVGRVERSDVPYMVRQIGISGSGADPDVVLDLRAADALRLRPLFPEHAFYVPSDGLISEEAARARRGRFHIVHRLTGRRAEVHVATDDPLFEWAFSRRVRYAGEVTDVWLAPVEYAVLRALESHRETGSDADAQRVAALVRSSRRDLDYVELGRWMGRLAREP